MRLIDADALEIILKSYLNDRKAYENSVIGRITTQYADAVNALRATVMEMPTIEAVPVRRCGRCAHAWYSEDGAAIACSFKEECHFEEVRDDDRP